MTLTEFEKLIHRSGLTASRRHAARIACIAAKAFEAYGAACFSALPGALIEAQLAPSKASAEAIAIIAKCWQTEQA